MSCEPNRLQLLLTGDEGSAEFRRAQQHIDSCPQCQQRLLELSGDNSLVREACETLRQEGEVDTEAEWGNSSVIIQLDSLQGADNPIDSETISLNFLSPPSQPDLLGRLGRYEIERVIGTGGMGVVLKGYDTELHRVVAIKVLLPHLANSGAARRRFAREAQAAAAVMHEHVIPIHNVEIEGDISYLVMQYVPGQSLQARVDEQGPLRVAEILRLARQAALGLAAAHEQGVVHRDVKPANMLLEESVDRLLISDFGLARTVDDATLTRTGIVAGTPHYMSPEQAEGEVVDQRSDLFSLGSVIYFMCTGRPPFRAPSPMAVLHRICHETHRPVDEVNAEIPVELAEVVEQLLSKKPSDRFTDAKAVAARLDELLLELQRGGQLRRRNWKRRLLRTLQQWRGRLALGAAGLACVLFGVWASRWFGGAVVTREVAPPVLSVAASPSPVPTEPPTKLSEPIILDPDTFASDLRQAQELLDRIEARDAMGPIPAPDARWEQEVSELRSQTEL